MSRNPCARKFRFNREQLLAGEGELHGLLKACGLSVAEFCELAGIQRSTFYRWYGEPLYRWPVVLLFNVAWARNMAKHLAMKGFDPACFHPQMPPSTKAGHRFGPADLVIQGLTEEERNRIRHNQAVARGRARWKDHKEPESDPDYTPWKL